MRDNYVVKTDILKGYLNNFTGENSSFTNGARKTFSNGYLCNCSNSTIITMKNKLENYYSLIDKGYSNIKKWFSDYIEDSNNVEKSLKEGSIIVNDSSTRSVLQKTENKNNAKIDTASDIDYLIKNNTASATPISSTPINDSLSDINQNNSGTDSMDELFEKFYNQFYLPLGSLIPKEELKKVFQYQQVISSLTNSRTEIESDINSITDQMINLVNMNWPVTGEGSEPYDEVKELEYLLNKDPNYIYKIKMYDGQEPIEGFEFEYDFADFDETQKEYIKLVMLKIQKQSEITQLDLYIKQYENAKALVPYESMMEKDNYKEFANTFDFEEKYKYYVEHENDSDFDWDNYSSIIVAMHNINSTAEGKPLAGLETIYVNDNPMNPYSFSYATEKQQMMYYYLLETKGKAEADNYLTIILDDINRAQGLANAEHWKEELDKDISKGSAGGFLSYLWDSTGEGLSDGFSGFFEGIEGAFHDKKVVTASEYEKMYKSQFASEYGLSMIYNVNSSVGRMLPSIALNIVPGGQLMGSAVFGFSAYGEGLTKAKRTGADWFTSQLYAIGIGTSEAITEYYLGGIPGLSKSTSSIGLNMLKEGLQEFTQTYYESALGGFLLGEEIDLGSITEEAFIAFAYGAATSAYMTGAAKLPKMATTAVKCKINGVEMSFNLEQMQQKLEEKGIISTFGEEGTNGIDAKINMANYQTSNRYIAEIKLDSISSITAEQLSKIQNPDLVVFTTNGETYTFNKVYEQIMDKSYDSKASQISEDQTSVNQEYRDLGDEIDALPASNIETGITDAIKTVSDITSEANQESVIKDIDQTQISKVQEQLKAVNKAISSISSIFASETDTKTSEQAKPVSQNTKLRIDEKSVDFAEMFSGRLGESGDAVSVIGPDYLVTRYNNSTQVGNHDGNLASILSDIKKETITAQTVRDEVPSTNGVVRYLTNEDFTLALITLPTEITPEFIETFEILAEQWKATGEDSGFMCSDDEFNALFDPDEEGLSVAETDKLINFLKEKVNSKASVETDFESIFEGNEIKEKLLSELNTPEANLIKSETEKFDVNAFYHGQGASGGGIGIITATQSISADTFIRRESQPDYGDHRTNANYIYKQLYGREIEIKGPAWQESVMDDGNIVIQYCYDISTPIFIPQEINEYQAQQIIELNEKIKKAYQSDPEFFKKTPMEFSITFGDEEYYCVNSLDDMINKDPRLSKYKKPIISKFDNNINMLGTIMFENGYTSEQITSYLNSIPDDYFDTKTLEEIMEDIQDYFKDSTIDGMSDIFEQTQTIETAISAIDSAFSKFFQPDENYYYGVDQHACDKVIRNKRKNNNWLKDVTKLEEVFRKLNPNIPENLISEIIDIIANNVTVSDISKDIIIKYIETYANTYEEALEIYNNSFETEKSANYMEVITSLTEQGLTETEAIKLLKTVDSVGACTYAAYANNIISYYLDNEAQFKKDFGYDLFKIVDGKKVINAERILLDLYIFANTDTNGGKMLHYENGKLSVISLDANDQTYLSKRVETRDDILNAFLKSKNPNLSFSDDIECYSSGVYMDFLGRKVTLGPFKNSGDLTVEELRTKIKDLLESGNRVHLGIYQSKDTKFSFYDMKGNLQCDTNTWSEGGGHAVFVTDVTEDYVIVSSWGTKLQIPIEEFIDNEFTISYSKITGIETSSESEVKITNEKGLLDARKMPLSSNEELRTVQNKIINNEPLSFSDKLKMRDSAVIKFDGVDLHSDHAYRATTYAAVNDYFNRGVINDNGSGKGYTDVDWYIGGTSTRYGKVIIETPADPSSFTLTDDYGGFMSGSPYVRHAHSSNTTPVSTNDVTRVIFLDNTGSKVLKVIDPKTSTNISEDLELGNLLYEQDVLEKQKAKQGTDFSEENQNKLNDINNRIKKLENESTGS